MQVIKDITELRRWRKKLKGSLALVPTMGALHEGHMALVKRAGELADNIAVSIFVNPTQFGEGEDLDKYPRTLDADLQKCKGLGAAMVFVPDSRQMYPSDVVPSVLDVPDLTGRLEGEFRPGHFAGVCRVCLKLFNLVQPQVACFGQKDYQQLAVIGAVAADLNLEMKIESVPTVRDEDGLALSSRNHYLTDADRPFALGLVKALKQGAHLINKEGETDPDAVERAMAQVMIAHRVKVDYAVLRHNKTLEKFEIIEPAVQGAIVALVAGHLQLSNGGRVRLIDNMIIGGSEKPVARASSPCLKAHGQDAHVTKKSFSEPLIGN